MRKLFVLDEGVEIPSVPASASSKSRGHYPLVRVGTIEGITVVSGVSRGKSPFGESGKTAQGLRAADCPVACVFVAYS